MSRKKTPEILKIIEEMLEEFEKYFEGFILNYDVLPPRTKAKIRKYGRKKGNKIYIKIK